MDTDTFHISPYHLAFLGTIFTGLTFALQLWFTKKINRAANRFLALALATVVLWMAWILGIDIRMGDYFPRWSWLPLQFSLALGPLIFFYVLKLTRPEYKFGLRDLLHFIPVILEQFILRQPVLLFLTFISVITYLYGAHRLIEGFYRRLKFTGSDRYRYEFRWLHRLLTVFGLLWLLWIPYTAVDYFGYNGHLGTAAFYPLYLVLAVTIMWIGATAFLRPEVELPVRPSASLRPSVSMELKQKGAALKKAIEANRYFEDAELSVGSLAKKLEMHPNELSRIINMALKKNFSDFINEYRIREVARKMLDPAFDRMTLLGIAYESGFNSKATFNRTFKLTTGKSPVEYKNRAEKSYPIL